VTAQVIAVAVAAGGLVSVVIGVLGYRLQVRQAGRQVREAAISRAQGVYLSGMTQLAAGGRQHLIGVFQLSALAADPTAGQYAHQAQLALTDLLPLLDSLPAALDGLDSPGTH